MSLQIIKGNIFNSRCQTIVNTINCVGVMGAGIALEFRLRYPEMYQRYVKICQQNLIQVGKLWIYKTNDKWILNFPTKKHWKYPSKIKYLELGLKKFIDTYEDKKITSVAFPLLGANNGKINPDTSLKIMEKFLSKCTIPIEIYIYSPQESDNLYENFKIVFNSMSAEQIANLIKLNKKYVIKIKEAINNPDINNFSSLASVKGLGLNSLEKAITLIHAFPK
jgi:O-acetyl-ADP-ribose deacetylase (regulator of RNase III)